MRLRPFLLLLLAMPVIACGESAEAPTPDLAASTAQITPAPTSTRTPTPSATPEPTVVPGDFPGVLLVDYGDRDGWDSGSPGAARGALVALDAATGEELEWWPPMNVGQASKAVPAPDGQRLAVTWHETQDSGSTIRLLDAATRERVFDVEEPHNLSHLTWSPDGTTIYGISERVKRWDDPMRSGVNVRGSDIWAVDARSGEVRRVADVAFQVHALRVDRAGGHLYALAFHSEQCCGIDIEGDPFLAAVDIESGEVTGEVALPGLVIGQTLKDPEADEARPDGIHWPAPAIAPSGGRLYVAHADDASITVVDLEQMEVVERVTPEPPKSVLGRFGSWLGGLFVSEASAKGALYFTREAAVSQDGRWLFVTGTGAEDCPEGDSFSCLEHAPAGLRIIDTETMDLVAEHDRIGYMRFTPDGRRVIGWGLAHDYREGGRAEVLPHGPYIIDTETHELIAAAETAFAGWNVAVSSDGRYGYTVVDGPGHAEAMVNQGRCESSCWLLHVFELETATILATRSFEGLVALESLVPE